MLNRSAQAGLLVALAMAACTATPPSETGFLDRVVVVDGAEYRYQIYVPREYQSADPWPVILFLHGGGSRGANGIRPTERGLGRAIRRNPERYPAIAVFPQSPVGLQWEDLSARIALAALDALGWHKSDSHGRNIGPFGGT